MQSVETKGVEALDNKLDELLNTFPKLRRELHERLGRLAKARLDAAIGGTGRVQRWQEVRIGSGGGYAAVSARRGALPSNGRGQRYAFGQVTNAIESGHQIRPPQAGKGFRTRIRVAYVNGRYFYRTVQTAFKVEAIREANRFAGELAQRLEDGK